MVGGGVGEGVGCWIVGVVDCSGSCVGGVDGKD